MIKPLTLSNQHKKSSSTQALVSRASQFTERAQLSFKPDPLLERERMFMQQIPGEAVKMNRFKLRHNGGGGAVTDRVEIKRQNSYLQCVETKRKRMYDDFKSAVINNGQTYLQFGFKTEEKQENYYIKEFLKSMNYFQFKAGTMGVSDMWANKQIKRFLEVQRFTKDKLLLSKFNKAMQNRLRNSQRNEKGIELQKGKFQEKPQLPQLPTVNGESNSRRLQVIISDLQHLHEENVDLYSSMKL